jgi:hypothetical protein
MVRAKPDLFLTVPNTLDAETYTRSDLITPPCYIVTAPPPLLTPALSRSSSLSTSTSHSESDFEDDDEDMEVSLRIDAAPWTEDQDAALLNVHRHMKKLIQTYAAHLDGPAVPSAPFDVSRPPPTVAAKISRNAIHINGWRGRRSVASTRRRLLKLAREKYTGYQGDRMDLDPLDSSSALSMYPLLKLS